MILPLVALLLVPSVRIRGAGITGWTRDAYDTSRCASVVRQMRQIGVDTLQINVWEFQRDKASTVIRPVYSSYSATPSSVRRLCRLAHGLGMKVMLKPIVDFDGTPNEWRATIPASKPWFVAYRRFIARWAKLAQEEKADYLSVGCELSATEGDEEEWRRTIREVRGLYRGPLTYAANFDTADKIRWWNALDYIGIDAYYPLSRSNEPTAAELAASWRRWAGQIDRWRSGKQVIFTEAGYRSSNGTNREPWEYNKNPGQDLTEQRQCFEAMFSVLWPLKWWAGACIWNWETDPKAGIGADPNYTPQNKPALDVVRHYYQLRP